MTWFTKFCMCWIEMLEHWILIAEISTNTNNQILFNWKYFFSLHIYHRIDFGSIARLEKDSKNSKGFVIRLHIQRISIIDSWTSGRDSVKQHGLQWNTLSRGGSHEFSSYDRRHLEKHVYDSQTVQEEWGLSEVGNSCERADFRHSGFR